MDTLRLVDVGVLFTFFLSSFLLLFWGGLAFFFCRIAPLRQPFGPHKKFFGPCASFFFLNHSGVTCIADVRCFVAFLVDGAPSNIRAGGGAHANLI